MWIDIVAGRQKLSIILQNKMLQKLRFQNLYRKFASSNTYHLEAYAGFFRLLMKGIFDPYVPFAKKLIF